MPRKTLKSQTGSINYHKKICTESNTVVKLYSDNNQGKKLLKNWKKYGIFINIQNSFIVLLNDYTILSQIENQKVF